MFKQNPKDRLYSRDHEWIKDNDKGTVIVGITDYAQGMLTDIVFVDLPEIGKKVVVTKSIVVRVVSLACVRVSCEVMLLVLSCL